MLRLGIVGWRGMVGSVLLERMREENDFTNIEPVFFSTSNAGGAAPREANGEPLKNAGDLRELAACDIVISCQGGDYTKEVYAPLRKDGWKGYWIDAASALRMADDAVIVLDPVNADVIQDGLRRGIRTFPGGNCTVSLMLMAVGGLFKAGLVEWMTTMTYQAASGAGAATMLELVKQMECLTDPTRAHPSESALEVDRMMIEAQRGPSLPAKEFGAPLAGSLLPWIDEGHARRPDPRRMERHRRNQQDSGARPARARRWHLRARRHHALPQPGPVHQAQKGRPARRNRRNPRAKRMRGCA